MKNSGIYRKGRLFFVVAGAVTLVFLASRSFAQHMFISTLGDQTGTLALYKQKGDDFEKFALAEIKGSIEWGAEGIVKGQEAFLRLQTTESPDKWLKITNRELSNGRLVITTEDQRTYTIYDLQGNYLGKIKEGRFVEQPETSSASGASVSKPASQDEKMKWFREAKFGLFIHWGLYAVPAGTWKDRQIPGIGEWIMNRAKIPVKEYEQLAAQFNPVKFNADEWVKLAKDAGMKYIVITSKHHDGFAMYGSKVSKYNIVDATPFKRDPIKELAKACAKQGIRFGFYYSQSQDWHEPNGIGNTWDFGPNEKKDFDQYLRDKAEPQVKELLSGYGPVCLIWFDTPMMMTRENEKVRGQRFVDIVRTLQPACLIDGRLGIQGDYRSMGDNRIPNEVVHEDWEVPATLNNTWGYKSYDNNWKTPEDLTFKLVDIVSKGGNYLLNVGPTAEGLIPQPSQDNLRAVGRWLRVNGESIYGAGPTPFGEEFGAYDPEKKDSRGNKVFNSKTHWRCTTKPGKLFIHLFKWPPRLLGEDKSGGSFELSKVKGKVNKAYLLADAERKGFDIKQEADRVTVSLPQTAPDKMDSVLVLEVAE